MKPINVLGIGAVTLEEFEAMLYAWLNAGAPKPVLGGEREEKTAILNLVVARGDSQIRAVAKSYLGEL